MRWQRIICWVAFHTWVRRPTPGDDAGYRHECARCGKINEGFDPDPRVQHLG